MDKTKRWWLWQDEYGDWLVMDHESILDTVKCTEVLLVPVNEDEWNYAYAAGTADDCVTLCVKRGSLEEAIYWTRRGERWVLKDRPWLSLRLLGNGDVQMVNVGGKGEVDCALYFISPCGWHRVEDPLLCPACGAEAKMHEYCGKWTVSCPSCELRFGTGSAYPFATEAEAREAFRKMGGAR